ncbi:Fungal specific transcription factor domain-containing protein [Cladophialophora immunda]|nr:Fungal specific transcription factor domain-containing protein [Cladophialophora immunda]
MLSPESVQNTLKKKSQVQRHATLQKVNKIRQTALPMLGLQPSEQELFPQWQTSGEYAQSIQEALPDKTEILELFSRYLHVVYPLNPFLLDIGRFEIEIGRLLEAPSSRSLQNPQIYLLRSKPAWTALLFAVLASGLQCARVRTSDDKLKCRRHISTAFHCLHLAQASVKPSLDCIQALVVLVHVLQNELLTEAAWTLVGLVSRQAQSLGLHVEKTSLQQDGSNGVRQVQLWWIIMWQDSLLSLCFDRAPVTAVKCTDPFHTLVVGDKELGYQEAMCALTHVTLKISARRYAFDLTNSANTTYEDVMRDFNMVEQIKAKLRAEIRVHDSCRSIQDLVHYTCFRLHSSFVQGALLRPSLNTKNWRYLAPSQRQELATKGINSYKNSLDAYLNLLATSTSARRSWAMLHNGLASALILAITGQIKHDSSVASMLERLFATLRADSSPSEASTKELWDPHERGLWALQRMYERQTMEATSSIMPLADPVMGTISAGAGNGGVSTPSPAPGPVPSAAEPFDIDYFTFDPQSIGEISAFLPENVTDGDLMVDDVFDSVLWGSG